MRSKRDDHLCPDFPSSCWSGRAEESNADVDVLEPGRPRVVESGPTCLGFDPSAKRTSLCACALFRGSECALSCRPPLYPGSWPMWIYPGVSDARRRCCVPGVCAVAHIFIFSMHMRGGNQGRRLICSLTFNKLPSSTTFLRFIND